jgi:hypothetical protein
MRTAVPAQVAEGRGRPGAPWETRTTDRPDGQGMTAPNGAPELTRQELLEVGIELSGLPVEEALSRLEDLPESVRAGVMAGFELGGRMLREAERADAHT